MESCVLKFIRISVDGADKAVVIAICRSSYDGDSCRRGSDDSDCSSCNANGGVDRNDGDDDGDSPKL